MKFRLFGVAIVLLSSWAAMERNAGADACPRKPYNDVCIQVITWAQNPNTGHCCQYPNPCVVPDGWQTFTGPGCTNGGIEGL